MKNNNENQSNEKVDIKILGDNFKELTLIHKYYEEERVIYPVALKIIGHITSPANYAIKRKAMIDKDKAVVEVDIEGNSIRFSENPKDIYGAVIDGNYKPNKELEKFRINSNTQQFKIADLINLFRFNKDKFKSIEDCNKLIQQLQNLKVSISTEYERIKNENRGNFKYSIEQNVKTELEITFDLLMALFDGEDKTLFKCMLCYEVRENELSFWIESDELPLLEETIKTDKILVELEKLKDYLIIYK